MTRVLAEGVRAELHRRQHAQQHQLQVEHEAVEQRLVRLQRVHSDEEESSAELGRALGRGEQQVQTEDADGECAEEREERVEVPEVLVDEGVQRRAEEHEDDDVDEPRERHDDADDAQHELRVRHQRVVVLPASDKSKSRGREEQQ